MKELSEKAAKARAEKISEPKRKAIARKAAKARWQKPLDHLVGARAAWVALRVRSGFLPLALLQAAHVQISDTPDYSMISSAAAEKAIGTSMPSPLAVLRLRINSYLTACITGSSPGFSPLRMRAT
jgi:hypothetical protein